MRPVFWVQQPLHVWTALVAAVGTFVAVRFTHMPHKMLAIADAFGLALFGIAGTEKALALGTPGVVAVLLGIVTGVAGGILRDVLRREVPLVFQPEIQLYATAVFAGALVLMRRMLLVGRRLRRGVILRCPGRRRFWHAGAVPRRRGFVGRRRIVAWIWPWLAWIYVSPC